MFRLLFLFILLIAGLVAGPIVAGHQGYVLIQTDAYNIETSVTGLAIILVLLVGVILALEWLLRRIFRTTARTRGWFSGRKRNRAHKQTKAALLKLAEGDFNQVEKLLTRNADHAEQPVVNYLLAAEAAQQRGDAIRSHQYLERAAEAADTDQLPVDIARVRIQLAEGEVFAARHGVDQLLSEAPRHPEVLRLAEQAYISSGAEGSLLDILPSMRKIHLYDDDKLLELEQKAHIGLMNQAMVENNSEGLNSWWQQQSRKVRHDVVIQIAMIEHLIQCDDHDMAQQILLDGLKRHYDERLVRLIPQLKSGNPEQLEKVLQQQIKKNGDSPLLNSTLGRVLMSHGEWQSAYDALKASLSQQPDAQNYATIADVLDKLRRPDEAARMRREGLLLTLKSNPEP